MKKIVAIYKGCLQRINGDAIKNPFLALNIMCPVGSYDPNIEPAKDSALFTVESEVLDAIERFFDAMYGANVKATKGPQTESTKRLIKTRSMPPRFVSQVSNTTANSQLTDLDILHETTIHRQVQDSTNLAFRPSPSPEKSTSRAESFIDLCLTQESTDHRSLHLQRPKFDSMQATAGRSTQAGLQEFNTQDDFEEEDDIDNALYRNPWEVALSTAAAQKTIRAPMQPPKEHSFGGGPMNAFLKHRTEPSMQSMDTSKIASSQKGTPLSKIPDNVARKRKATTRLEFEQHGHPTPATKRTRVDDHTGGKRIDESKPLHTAAKARLSFPPNFSSPISSPAHQSYALDTPGQSNRLDTGLATPDISPLKRAFHLCTPIQQPYSSPLGPQSRPRDNVYLAQKSPLPQDYQLPTPVANTSVNKTPTAQIPILNLRGTSMSQISTEHKALTRYDTYTRTSNNGSNQQRSAFNLDGLSSIQAEAVIIRCKHQIARLIGKDELTFDLGVDQKDSLQEKRDTASDPPTTSAKSLANRQIEDEVDREFDNGIGDQVWITISP